MTMLSIPSLSLIYILLLGVIHPCMAGGADQPEQIIRKMYSDLLNRNFAGDITSKNNRSKYFMPSLVRLYDASDAAEAAGKPPCIDFNIQVNGQDFDAGKLRNMLIRLLDICGLNRYILKHGHTRFSYFPSRVSAGLSR